MNLQNFPDNYLPELSIIFSKTNENKQRKLGGIIHVNDIHCFNYQIDNKY